MTMKEILIYDILKAWIEDVERNSTLLTPLDTEDYLSHLSLKNKLAAYKTICEAILSDKGNYNKSMVFELESESEDEEEMSLIGGSAPVYGYGMEENV